jgi:hypothetical protein
MLDIFGRRLIIQTTVRPFLIVFLPPGFDDDFGFLQRCELVLVQTLIPELAIEALAEGVLDRLTRLDEMQLHAVAVGPFVERLSGKFWSVVHHQRFR